MNLPLSVVQVDAVLLHHIRRELRRGRQGQQHTTQAGTGLLSEDAVLREQRQGADGLLDGDTHRLGDRADELEALPEVLHRTECLVRTRGEEVGDVGDILALELNCVIADAAIDVASATLI
jgi:hypothetical protein